MRLVLYVCWNIGIAAALQLPTSDLGASHGFARFGVAMVWPAVASVVLAREAMHYMFPQDASAVPAIVKSST
jgi:hypothetical protein